MQTIDCYLSAFLFYVLEELYSLNFNLFLSHLQRNMGKAQQHQIYLGSNPTFHTLAREQHSCVDPLRATQLEIPGADAAYSMYLMRLP